MLIRFTVVLTMLAPPSQSAADAAYNAGEFGKALDLFLERAADPGVHRPDALLGAHDSLLALHDETGEVEHLCRALTLARELLAQGPFADEEERAAWVETEARDVDTARRVGATCTPASSEAPTTTPPAASEPGRLTAAAVEPREPDADLLPVTGRAPVRGPTTQAPRGSGLTIAGGVTLGVGLALTGAAGYTGGRMLDAWRESQALHSEAGSLGTEAQAERDSALAHEYQQHRAPMLTTAIIGASALIVGAVLVGVGAKRLARVASRTALMPTPGGLVLHARF